MKELVAQYAKEGLLGLLLLTSLVWHWRREKLIERLNKQIQDIAGLRTSDAQQVAKEIISLGEKLGLKVSELSLLVSELNRIVKDDREDILQAVRRLFRESLAEMRLARSQSGAFRALLPEDPEDGGGKES